MREHDGIDEALVERARAGDIEAFAVLVAATERLVRTIVARLIADPSLRDDVVQETYLRAFRGLPRLTEARAFPRWLGRVAANAGRNELRRRRGAFADVADIEEVPAPAPDELADAELMRRELERALIRLAPDERQLVERYYVGRWSTRRLATDAGVSTAAIRKRLQRLRDHLRRDMTMDRRSPPPQQLPERVIALLSRPRLTTLPENPVGEVWQRIHAALGSPEVLALPEILEATALAALLGDDAAQRPDVHRIGDGRLLRFDQTAPLLLAARGRPVGATLAAAGKVYRAVDRDHGHLQAFHQAELLWLRDRAQRWSPMGPLEAVVDAVLPGAGLRVESADYALYGDRGYSVAVERHGRWHAIAGWARFSSRIVTALGHDPTRTCAFGLGLGLERLAAVVFDIDDVRRVAASRVDEP